MALIANCVPLALPKKYPDDTPSNIPSPRVTSAWFEKSGATPNNPIVWCESSKTNCVPIFVPVRSPTLKIGFVVFSNTKFSELASWFEPSTNKTLFAVLLATISPMVKEGTLHEVIPSFPDPSTFTQLPPAPERAADVIAPAASTFKFPPLAEKLPSLCTTNVAPYPANNSPR